MTLHSSLFGSSPSKTHRPASIQNPLDIRKGPHRAPFATQPVNVSHLVLASQMQPRQLLVILSSVSSKHFVVAERKKD